MEGPWKCHVCNWINHAKNRKCGGTGTKGCKTPKYTGGPYGPPRIKQRLFIPPNDTKMEVWKTNKPQTLRMIVYENSPNSQYPYNTIMVERSPGNQPFMNKIDEIKYDPRTYVVNVKMTGGNEKEGIHFVEIVFF